MGSGGFEPEIFASKTFTLYSVRLAKLTAKYEVRYDVIILILVLIFSAIIRLHIDINMLAYSGT